MVDNGTEQGSTAMKISSHQIRSAIMSLDQNFLAVVTDQSVKLWNLKTDNVHKVTGGPRGQSQKIIKFSHDSKYLFFNADDTQITKWDAE